MATRTAPGRAEENAQNVAFKDVKQAEGRARRWGVAGPRKQRSRLVRPDDPPDPPRRALGDIGNVGGVTTRAQAAKVCWEQGVSRDCRGARRPGPPRVPWARARSVWAPGPRMRDPEVPPAPRQVAGKPTALRPREPAAAAGATTAAAAAAAAPAAAGSVTSVAPRLKAAQHKGGSSLSSLLQSRSEYAATKRAATPPSPLPDIDSKDLANPLAEAGYAHDIYCYYRRVEPRFAAPCDYMDGQARARAR
jgi:hypothetical protein